MKLDGKKELVKSLLGEHQWNVTEVTRQLRKRNIKVSRSTLRETLDEWEIERPEVVPDEPLTDLVREWEYPTLLDKKVVSKQNVKELWNAVQHMQQAHFDTSILQERVHISLDFDKPIAITFLSDLHIGALGTNYQYILNAIDLILGTRGCYVAILGDIIDNFIWGKGTQFEEITTPRIQKIMATDLIKELFNITVWINQGCHEEFSKTADDFDFMEYLATHSRGAYLGMVGDAYLDVSGAKYHIHSRHRYKFESHLNIENAFRRMYDEVVHFDVGAIAHSHDNPFVMHRTRGKGVHRKDSIYVRPGTAKIYDRYGRHRFGGFGTEFAVPMVIFMPEERSMIPFKNLNVGLHMLDLLRKDWERNDK